MHMKNKNYKIYINKINENWIVDRLKKEFVTGNKHLVTNNLRKADLIWIIAPWNWRTIKKKYLISKKVICTIHHIDELKFIDEKEEFLERENYIDFYHVPSLVTKHQLEKITQKKVIYIPFWIDSKKWFIKENKLELREKYNIESDSFVIGSFQRDSEGSNLSVPKLSKGPDRLIEMINYFNKNKQNLRVLLTGKRRNYVIAELEKLGIKYSYYEMATPLQMNDFYNLLDLYIVSSRFEGGPFAIYESAITKTPIISTNVGIASEILAKESIYEFNSYLNARPNVEEAFKNVQKFTRESLLPKYVEEFINL
jgi:glycosyltransferase involved in cell wall biosynthesis